MSLATCHAFKIYRGDHPVEKGGLFLYIYWSVTKFIDQYEKRSFLRKCMKELSLEWWLIHIVPASTCLPFYSNIANTFNSLVIWILKRHCFIESRKSLTLQCNTLNCKVEQISNTLNICCWMRVKNAIALCFKICWHVTLQHLNRQLISSQGVFSPSKLSSLQTSLLGW